LDKNQVGISLWFKKSFCCENVERISLTGFDGSSVSETRILDIVFT
jgi:hypothetical protein